MLYIYNRKSLTYEHIKIKHYVYNILIVLFIGSGFGFSSSFKFNKFIEKIPVLIKQDEEILSKQYVESLLIKYNIQNKDIVLQQILLETGNLTSQSCLKGKNLTGMKKVYSRQHSQEGVYLNHAMYKSYEQSILDYAIFQARYCSNLSSEQYYSFLKQYAQDENYISKLKHIKLSH